MGIARNHSGLQRNKISVCRMGKTSRATNSPSIAESLNTFYKINVSLKMGGDKSYEHI